MPRTFSILFADDGPGSYRRALAGKLGAARPHWEFTFTTSLASALEFLASHPPDAVVSLLELSPGGTEGLEILAQARALLPRVPVILITGGGDPHAIRDACIGRQRSGEPEGRGETPDGLFFREEIFSGGRLGDLEETIARGLYGCGRVSNARAVLVTHGTDTLAWGLAYLRYSLKNLTANVAVTGSQVPLEGYFSASDALGNLKTAVFLLNRLRPARLFAVFNNGRSVFTGRLTKFRKWDTDAFEGKVAASAGAEGVRPLRKDWVYIPYPDQRLEELHLIRTGGTIESHRESGEGDALRPTGDFVWKYLNESLSEFFERGERHDLFALDSSNMSFEEWAQLAQTIERIGVAKADTRFDETVKPVFTNPLFTTADYRAQFAACGAGAVLAGFGGGNGNVLEDSPHCVLRALKEAVEAGTFVAVTSQVPLEPYDAEYETGLALLRAGGVPCGDLPLADAQVKLSYILGHDDELCAAAARSGVDPRGLRIAAFLAGVSMRRAWSMEVFRHFSRQGTLPRRFLDHDPFLSRPFAEGLGLVLEGY
jgi:L-asparaginase/Glu-tRNA(Gln) amidotransferase subunit D/CheY-like chemotaxis protein